MDWKDMAGSNLKYLENASITSTIVCPFCQRNAGFEINKINQRDVPPNKYILNFWLKCSNCGNIFFIIQETIQFPRSSYEHRYVLYPSRPDDVKPHESWPLQIATYITEARRNLITGGWNSAAIMARTVLQAVMRDFGASGKNLQQEIDDLAQKRVITDAMKDWAHHIRLVGNDVVHPDPAAPTANEDDARDLVRFTEAFLQYVYTIPWDMKIQKDRPKG